MQVTQIIHAYKQAPWRVQRQYTGAFLLIVIGIAMIAALYLMVSARAAITGREIQSLRDEIIVTRRINADLEARIGDLTSTSAMQQRARQLNYRPVLPGELEYLAVPNFFVPEPAILLAAQDTTEFERIVPPEYTQSLIEWFDERIRLGGAQ
ncbi:MAG: hypothetical protein OZ914_01440 [Anaerolineaceae bacterium]|jgi:cell division protein FtsL|nr:hypothetical protein [Anaerolineales bacterium]MEB2332959.1 hypothetical protein [Anaerolineaceae bacterium]OQY89166.1 MAG: hypothetical protein B6D38_07395 [Anaerolineae bacterium UTCFX1]